jgi:hypothetical protein
MSVKKRIEHLEKQRPKPVKYVIRWVHDPEPELEPGDVLIRLKWPEEEECAQ